MKKTYFSPAIYVVEHEVETWLVTSPCSSSIPVKEGEGEDAANSFSIGSGSWGWNSDVWDDDE